MLEATAALFPEGVSLMNFFYGIASPVFLIDENEEIIKLSSEQGSRQGCTAGCLGFCLSLVKVLRTLQIKYDEYEFRVVVHDIIP